MALLSTLSKAIAEAEGLEETTVSWIARHLREAGLISQAGRGRGAAHMKASDATNLLIAVNGADNAKNAVEAVGKIRALRVGLDPRCKTENGLFADICKYGTTFGDAIETLISASIHEDDGVSVLEMEMAAQPSIFEDNQISIGFGRPQNAGFIAVSEGGPPNPGNPFNANDHLSSIMFAYYWDARKIWSQNAGRRDLTIIGRDVLMKVGRTLSS